jgi:spermidine synthase
LFATGCAGIVAEFVLSTLATYMLGNAIVQWTVVMSLMLFAMGIGSRVSRFFHTRLLDAFVAIEFGLSILCAVSAILAYTLAPFIDYYDLLIYGEAFAIGVLIGLEIPLVTRLNEAYEVLRVNISGVMEKDYYGALAGGLLFAFFALPHLGLTYTPIILGTINFLVASVILWRFFNLLERRKLLVSAFGATLTILVLLGVFAEPVMTYGEQRKYVDKIIYAEQTAYQKIVITQWKSDYWLYINGQEQFSTYDEERYHEPLVHPAMSLSGDPSRVLILGGGDGLALREVLKYPGTTAVTLVDLDPAMTGLSRTHPVLLTINEGALNDPRVTVVNQDAYRFLEASDDLFGVIIIDLPDPDTVDLMHVYSLSFYEMVRRHLIRGGAAVTQATSPYFSARAFRCILKTMGAAGFSVAPYHNQVPTMGEWGWVVGIRSDEADPSLLKQRLMATGFSGIGTRFLNRDAMVAMLHFGKGMLEPHLMEEIDINTKINPVLYRYYREGSWGIY